MNKTIMKYHFYVRNILLTLTIICYVACSNAQQQKQVTEISHPEFKLPEIPKYCTKISQRAEFLAMHWWDNFNFNDTTYIHIPKISEQAFVDFIDFQPNVAPEISNKSITLFLDRAIVNKKIFNYFIELAEKYLYDPNSAMRNEELYIPILKYITTSPKIDTDFKIRPTHLLTMAMKNRPGSMATDFTYTLSNEKTGRLHSIKSDYTIIFFNNPDCHDCKRVKDLFESSPVFSNLTKKKSPIKLVILGVYPDADIPLWLNATYPDCIINAYDAGQAITKNESYDLKAIPSLYLLDKDKKIILKDATIEIIENYLQDKIK
ncbi:MAG: DUF5106 domain-containing protein [Muribaculaceae bacterium]